MFDRAIRVAYFDADPSHFVADALYPAASALAHQAGTRVYLRTHWARGSHYDVVIERYRDVPSNCLGAARETIRRWLDRHPSTQDLQADYVVRSRRMADAEQWQGAIEPLYANNDMVVVANERTALWGSSALGEAAATFHCDVLADVAMLAAIRRESRAALILRAARLLISVAQMAEGVAFAFWPASLSAHARLFLTAHPSMRPVFEMAWDRMGGSAIRAIGDLVARGDGPDDLAGWTAAGAKLAAAVERIQADPNEQLAPIDVDNPLHIRDVLGSDAAVTERLTQMFDADRNHAVFASPRHHRFRIVVNVMYEGLAVATISPVERALACYLVSRAILADFPDVAAQARDAVAEMAETAHA